MSIKRLIKEKQAGFSLIELMIVVAIIGVLVAVAVPNFQKFLARSKQTEAKTNLGSLYAAQKAFYGEWNQYRGGFGVIGFVPEGNLRYRVTNADTTATAMPGSYPRTPTATDHKFDSAGYCGESGTPCTEDTTFAKAPTTSAAIDSTARTFLAVASSDLDGDVGIDEWTIDQGKDLNNSAIDL